MPVFKILRMKESAQQHFRWQPHTTGATQVKQKDFQEAGEIEAEGVYEAWQKLQETGNPLRVGDVFESEAGDLRICKFVGFEEAHWWVPEAKPVPAEPVPTEPVMRPAGESPAEPGVQPAPAPNS